RAEENQPDIQVVVDMVQLNVAITDDKGNYITGLGTREFVVTEVSISEKIATLVVGDEPARPRVCPQLTYTSVPLAHVTPHPLLLTARKYWARCAQPLLETMLLSTTLFCSPSSMRVSIPEEKLWLCSRMALTTPA